MLTHNILRKLQLILMFVTFSTQTRLPLIVPLMEPNIIVEHLRVADQIGSLLFNLNAPSLARIRTQSFELIM